MARRRHEWRGDSTVDLRNPETAREFLLMAMDEGVPMQVALGKVARALGVKTFATHVRMSEASVQRAIAPRHAPPVATANRLLAPFSLRLAISRATDASNRTLDARDAPIRSLAARVADREALQGSRLSAGYSSCGRSPKVDRLLDAITPRTAHERWRKGELRPSGRANKTSGVRVWFHDLAGPRALVRVVEAFLRRDGEFLQRASECSGRQDSSELLVMQFVYPFSPTYATLPARTLVRLGELGIELRTGGYPCED